MENKALLGNVPGVDLSALDAAQRGGHVCVRCGRVPLHRVDLTQVGEPDLIACSDEDAAICSRPVFWLAKPCPRWCNGLHNDCDASPDRRHFSSWEEQVPLTLEDAQENGAGVGMAARVRGREPGPGRPRGRAADLVRQGSDQPGLAPDRRRGPSPRRDVDGRGELGCGWASRSAATAVRHHRGVGRRAGSACRAACRASSMPALCECPQCASEARRSSPTRATVSGVVSEPLGVVLMRRRLRSAAVPNHRSTCRAASCLSTTPAAVS